MTPRRWQRPSWFAIVLTLAAVVLFTSLGFWQLQRMRWKQDLLDATSALLAERKPVALAQAADPARVHAYDWAQGTGAFANMDPILLDNQMRNGRAGVRVYRVFYFDAPGKPAQSAGSMLIDLGWLPWGPNRTLPDVALPGNAFNVRELSGLLAPPPSFGIALGSGLAHMDKGNAWLATRIDPDALAPTLLQWTAAWKPRLAPRVLRLDPTLPLGYERDLDVLPNTLPPARHLGYAVQWFAFALAALAAFVTIHWRKVEKYT